MNDKLKRRFNVLSIIISKECNGVCDYCLITQDKDKECHKTLPFEVYEKLVQIIQSFDLESYDKYPIAVQIVGGEPLLFPDYLVRVMSYLIKQCPQIDFTFNIYTNGCAATPEILKKLAEYPITLTYSLDEVTKIDTHRFYQGRPMNTVTMEKLLEANQSFPQIIRTNTVVSEYNYKGLKDVYKFHLDNKIWKWGWGFMRSALPEDAEWSPENFQEMARIITDIAEDAQNKGISLYNILEYSKTPGIDMTSENIPLYINLDETISTLAGDTCFRMPIYDFTWDKWFEDLIQHPTLYFLDSYSKNNLTECIHCHYREKHLAGKLRLPLSQCRWSMLLRDLYNRFYKENKDG